MSRRMQIFTFAGLLTIWLMIWASVWHESQVSARLNPAVVATAEQASPCPSGSNYLSAWNGDYTGDTDKLCYNSKISTLDGTLAGGGLLSTDYGKSGTVGFVGPDGAVIDDYLGWTLPVGNETAIIDRAVGTVCVDVWIPDAVPSDIMPVWELSVDTNNNIILYVRTVLTVRALFEIGGVQSDIVTTSDTLTAQDPAGFKTIRLSWHVANADMKIQIVGGAAAVEDTSVTGMNAWASEAVLMAIGERYNSAGVERIYIDNLRIYSTYDATCE